MRWRLAMLLHRLANRISPIKWEYSDEAAELFPVISTLYINGEFAVEHVGTGAWPYANPEITNE